MYPIKQSSKNKFLVAVFLLMSVLVAGCSAQESEEQIIGTSWKWAEMVETTPAAQSLFPDSENYTLLFNQDGTLAIKADCNMVGGSFTQDGNSLTIELGPSTMAFCGEQSLDQQYLGFLNSVERFSLENGRLILFLMDNAGQMTFDIN